MLPLSHDKLSLNQHVLAILSKSNHLKHLKQLQSFLITLGHGQTQFFAFKLVRFCALTLSNLDYARFVFDHLASPNVYLYTAMITAYASNSDHKSSFLLYRDMVRKRRPIPNQFVYPYVLKSCPEVMKCLGTELVHTQIVKSGFEKYPVVQSALLDSYARFCSDLGTARRVFEGMSERNIVSWTAMVSGYARVGEMGNAVLMFEEMPGGRGMFHLGTLLLPVAHKTGCFRRQLLYLGEWSRLQRKGKIVSIGQILLRLCVDYQHVETLGCSRLVDASMVTFTGIILSVICSC